MKQLTKLEEDYLKLAYEKGYRWLNTYGEYTYLHKVEPYVDYDDGMFDGFMSACMQESFIYFEVDDEEKPVRIAELLGIAETNWDAVTSFTPVYVRNDGELKWHKAYFYSYEDGRFSGGKRFRITYKGAWTYEDCTGEYVDQCRLATEKEIKECKKKNIVIR